MDVVRLSKQQLLLLEKCLEKLEHMSEKLDRMLQNSKKMQELLVQCHDQEDEEEETAEAEDSVEDTAKDKNNTVEVEEIIELAPKITPKEITLLRLDLVVPESERVKKTLEEQALPKVRLTKTDIEGVLVISDGWANPWGGFVRENEYLQSLHFNGLKREDGSVVNMSLPIVPRLVWQPPWKPIKNAGGFLTPLVQAVSAGALSDQGQRLVWEDQAAEEGVKRATEVEEIVPASSNIQNRIASLQPKYKIGVDDDLMDAQAKLMGDLLLNFSSSDSTFSSSNRTTWEDLTSPFFDPDWYMFFLVQKSKVELLSNIYVMVHWDPGKELLGVSNGSKEAGKEGRAPNLFDEMLEGTLTTYLNTYGVTGPFGFNATARYLAGLALKTKVLTDGGWSGQDAAILVPGDIISIKQGVFISTSGKFCICLVAIEIIVEGKVFHPIHHCAYTYGIENLIVVLIWENSVGTQKSGSVKSKKNYALNVPLNDGLDDECFHGLFRPIIHKVMEVYQPDAVVLQWGADSLSDHRLGCFNLSVNGHADCLCVLRSFNVPLMICEGPQCNESSVARCWCYETEVAVVREPDNKWPYNEYYEYFGPDYTIHVKPCNRENLNLPPKVVFWPFDRGKFGKGGIHVRLFVEYMLKLGMTQWPGSL